LIFHFFYQIFSEEATAGEDDSHNCRKIKRRSKKVNICHKANHDRYIAEGHDSRGFFDSIGLVYKQLRGPSEEQISKKNRYFNGRKLLEVDNRVLMSNEDNAGDGHMSHVCVV
jgi:hypothetical protein